MATAQSTKKANPEKENHPQDTYYKTTRDAYYHTGKSPICFHPVTKSTPKPFHSTASFYSQFYESILPFFCDKADMQKNSRRPSMAAAQSTKKANPEKENHPQDTYHKTNRSTCHEVSKKCVCFHSVTKSTPWAFFHRMDSFYFQFYKTILPFFCGKSRNRGEAICLTHPLL